MENQTVSASVRKRRIRKEITAWLMAVWPLVGFCLFGFIPLVLSVYLSFTKLTSFDFSAAKFIWLDNYIELFTDPDFYLAITNTLIYALSMPITLVLGLIIAVLLHTGVPGSKFFRSVFFIPYVCSIVAVSAMWKWMLNTDFGIVNGFIRALGGEGIPWLTEAGWYRVSLLIIIIWSGTGFNIILFQAALANVNKSYYEAADLDGANAFQKFFSLTLPAISPTTFYLVIMGFIGCLQVYTPMQVMANPAPFGPDNAGLTIVFYLVYSLRDGLVTRGMGLASAIAWILAAAIIIITILNFKISRKWVHYDE